MYEATKDGILAASNGMEHVFHQITLIVTEVDVETHAMKQTFESYVVPLIYAPMEFGSSWDNIPPFKVLPAWLEGLYAVSPILRQHVPDEDTMRRSLRRRHIFIPYGCVFTKPLKLMSCRVLPLTLYIGEN